MQLQGAEQAIVKAAASGNLDEVDLPENIKRLLDFVKMLTNTPYQNTPDEVQKLREIGWNDSQIAETVLVVGMFSMFNRVADAFGLADPNYFEKEKNGAAIQPATRPG